MRRYAVANVVLLFDLVTIIIKFNVNITLIQILKLLKNTTEMSASKLNKVLTTNKFSTNFFESDQIFRNYINKRLSNKSFKRIETNLDSIGKKAAGILNELSLKADHNPPELAKRDQWGEDIDKINFHPAYWEMMQIAIDSEMFTIKWDHKNDPFKKERNKMSFAVSYFFAMSESGLYCPLCMTDAAATLIEKHCETEDKERLLNGIASQKLNSLKTGAMFLTEKTGGSDVGANLVEATQIDNRYYNLKGEKWFCSNVNAEIIFALARTDSQKKGTRGLSIFLIEPKKRDGNRNPLNIVRLKDKLGVKSMASAECLLENTEGKLIGQEFNGFKIMTDMINISRLYNSVAALSASRRALVEAYQYLKNRKTFGKTAISHALVRKKLQELGAMHVSNFYLTWKTIDTLDAAEAGDEEAKQLLRVLTPMVKKWSAEKGVYITRESMELMGGIGYIEDQVMPKLMRDIMVLPIWEGAGNIMILDMLRASVKSDGLKIIYKEINKIGASQADAFLKDQLKDIQIKFKELLTMEQDEQEVKASYLFEDLTHLYQLALIYDAIDSDNKNWMEPTTNYLKGKITGNKVALDKLLSEHAINNLIGWSV